jgi:hypothetical protein
LRRGTERLRECAVVGESSAIDDDLIGVNCSERLERLEYQFLDTGEKPPLKGLFGGIGGGLNGIAGGIEVDA